MGEAVSVIEGERVAVGDVVGVGVCASRVDVDVAAAGIDGVAAGEVLEGVAVVITSGTSTYVDKAANRKPATRMMPMPNGHPPHR